MTKREQQIADYLSGMTIPEVAAKHGRTPGGLSTSFYHWGVRLPPEVRRARKAENVRKHLQGKAQVWPDCPDHLKADYETISRYMSKREARKVLEQ